MMKTEVLFENGDHRWVFVGRDPEKPDSIVDSNQFAVQTKKGTILLDPGGTEIFPHVLAALASEVDLKTIYAVFASHQDPDIVSSLPMWADLCPGLSVYTSWVWKGFISHFSTDAKTEWVELPDKGGPMADGLVAVPAHYCHSSAQFSVWDPASRILFSSDIGAALVACDYPTFVPDFDEHIQYMEGFHKRWMPSNGPLRNWVRRVRQLEPDMLCPQHGALFRGDDVYRFLDWLEALDVESVDPSAF